MINKYGDETGSVSSNRKHPGRQYGVVNTTHQEGAQDRRLAPNGYYLV